MYKEKIQLIGINYAVLPLDWVSASVCPVYKKGDKQCVANYRPISLTCLLTKILEKIVHFRLYSVLEQNQVLCDNQFGFRKSRSTTSLLLTAVDDWAMSLNSQNEARSGNGCSC